MKIEELIKFMYPNKLTFEIKDPKKDHFECIVNTRFNEIYTIEGNFDEIDKNCRKLKSLLEEKIRIYEEILKIVK